MFNALKLISMKSVNEIVNDERKNGAVEVSGITVKNASVNNNEKNNENRYVVLTLDKEIDVYRKDKDTGDYVKGKHTSVVVSIYSVLAMIGENEDTAALRNYLAKEEHQDALEMLLNHANISLLLVDVHPAAEGDEAVTYNNPFSRNPKPFVVQHDDTLAYMVSLNLSQKGKQRAEKIEDKILIG